MRTLVVYWPRANPGAAELATALHADLDLIVAREPRDGVMGWLRNAFDAVLGREVEIARPARKIEEYDLVVVGGPSSGASIAAPVRTFLDRYGARTHSLALFVTCPANHEGERALDAMTTLSRKAPLGSIVLHEGEHEAIERFAEALRRFPRTARPPSHRPPPHRVPAHAG